MAGRGDSAFLGHPAGLGWLSGSEFWERFSYYGMQALLVLYMTHHLLLPGHVENVWGFAAFRGLLESFYGPQSPAALASIIFGLYAGLVYLTPLAGGLLADRLTGRTAAVTIGALLMAAGHFLMAFEASFLLALSCLLIGVGCFKGNIAAQVGDLYAEDDPRRADAFQIYYIFIQVAVIISPLVCGTLGETVGWHWGFGAAGVGMLLGLAIYLFGRASLPKERMKGGEVVRPPMTRRDVRALVLLAFMLLPLALSLIGNQEIFNAYLIWAEKNYQTRFFGMTMPITWMLSLDAIVSTAMIAASVAFWRWYGRRWAEPDEITKITIGVGIAAIAPLTLAAASMVVAATGQPVSLGWALAFHLLNDIGFSQVLPCGLALYSRAAPKGLEGLMIAVYYLQFFLGNMLVGYVGTLYTAMPAVQFWLLHVALMAVAGVVMLAVRHFGGALLAPPYAPPQKP
ncbi:MAG: peptide MFS transporter [Alphaproteobacteria bacterium]|nr:peptide MFS transporter [Alphaproteobacteria bacterium]